MLDTTAFNYTATYISQSQLFGSRPSTLIIDDLQIGVDLGAPDDGHSSFLYKGTKAVLDDLNTQCLIEWRSMKDNFVVCITSLGIGENTQRLCWLWLRDLQRDLGQMVGACFKKRQLNFIAEDTDTAKVDDCYYFHTTIFPSVVPSYNFEMLRGGGVPFVNIQDYCAFDVERFVIYSVGSRAPRRMDISHEAASRAVAMATENLEIFRQTNSMVRQRAKSLQDDVQYIQRFPTAWMG